MESKKILFTVDGDSISPKTEQKAGVQGNHNITEVRFNVKEALVSGALGDSPTSKIRMQFIDGAGGFYSTGFLDVMSEILPDESAQYYVTCPIPNNITNAGGLAYVYLVVTEIDYREEKALEKQVYISPPGKLLYTHSGVGSPSEYAYRMGISSALVNAEIFVGQAEAASKEAEDARNQTAEIGNYVIELSDKTQKNATAAATSAANALISENNAKGFESAADESAKNARKSENRASTSADNAETSKTNAITSAINAKSSADAAASSATTARQDSDLAKKYRDETADMFENFKGIQLWQSNTKYKVDDLVFVNVPYAGYDAFPQTMILKSKETHTSSSNFDDDVSKWEIVISDIWASKSYYDHRGNLITKTYATKDELTAAIGEALEGDY